MDCSMPEGHEAHMELNGECPWCGEVGESNSDLDNMTPEETVSHLKRKYG